ncbi:MAG: MOSC domain-containing protein [Candidatus Aminicenantes bacterium]|nr:MOSC domain-containing protein [Candidatus Aminicenantes bacterium]
MNFRVVTICGSARKEVQKIPLECAVFKEEWGIEGDAHAGKWHRQVSFLAEEVCTPAWQRIRQKNPGIYAGPGAFGENILTRGIEWNQVDVGGRITIGEVELEVTQRGKPLHQENAILRLTGESVLPDQGVFARVIHGGVIHAGDLGTYRI